MARHASATQPRDESMGSVRQLHRARPGLTAGPLPRQLTRFIGRQHELAELVDLVTHHRVVTLTGAGGCGKTRLALEVAQRVEPVFPEGVMLVELASLDVGDGIAEALAAQLGLGVAPGADPLDALAAELADRRILLVLDNCEHVAVAVSAAIGALLRRCPELAVLATSRQDLDIHGAASWLVPPLDVSTTDASASDAVDLFADRAALASRTFRLTDANRPVVQEICKQLDGLPFAIELAASRVPTLGPRQILERIADRFGLLGAHTEGRHDTLGALVDWSYALLDEHEQALLRRLSVFAGSVDLDAVEAVTAGAGLVGDELVDALGALIRRSLVTADEVDGRARYRLLRTIAEYAEGKLVASGTAETWRDRHLQWCLAVSDPGPSPFGSDDRGWLHSLRTHLDDLRAATRYALGAGRGAAGLALAWRTSFLAEAEGIGVDDQELLDAALARTEGLVSRDRAFGLAMAGSRREVGGDPATARPYYEQALAVGRELDDPLVVGVALWNLGDAAVGAGADDVITADLYQESLDHLTRSGTAQAEADLVRRRLVATMLRRGDAGRARALLESTMHDAREPTDVHGLVVLAAVELLDGDDDACRELLEASVAAARQDGVSADMACALLNLADHRRVRDGVAAARDLYREAVGHAHAVDNLGKTVRALDGLAAAAADLGRPEAALRTFSTCDALAAGGALTLPFAEVSLVLAPQIQALRESEVARLRTQLGRPRVAPLVRKARSTDLDTAIAEALAATRPLQGDAGEATRPPSEDVEPPNAVTTASLARLGEVWEFVFDGHPLTVRDAKGVGYLAQLLADPNREFHVLDLSAPATRMASTSRADVPARHGPGHAGAAIDETARRQYEERVAQLRGCIDEATTTGDLEARARAREELDAIAHQLSAAYGLGGRPRTQADPAERARKAVSKCLRTSITRIERDHPALGRHLDAAVRTGRYCSYQPPEPIDWTVRLHPPT